MHSVTFGLLCILLHCTLDVLHSLAFLCLSLVGIVVNAAKAYKNIIYTVSHCSYTLFLRNYIQSETQALLLCEGHTLVISIFLYMHALGFNNCLQAWVHMGGFN